MPPSPLFFSELLILLGGIAAGQLAVTLIAAALLGLGFLGLAHALIEGLAGGEPDGRWRRGPTVRLVERLAVAIGAGLIALSATAYLLPGWSVIRHTDARRHMSTPDAPNRWQSPVSPPRAGAPPAWQRTATANASKACSPQPATARRWSSERSSAHPPRPA